MLDRLNPAADLIVAESNLIISRATSTIAHRRLLIEINGAINVFDVKCRFEDSRNLHRLATRGGPNGRRESIELHELSIAR
ncbi:MAG TPA: hypothetical protein VGM05_31580, partial [Planctomycetaceae bacterium]